MAATINTNIASINAQRNLALSGQSLNTTMQRLSSGLRVNSAKDDAAGLAIAERMNTQVKGLTVAARNANDGISLAQTAEGALGKVGDMLQRMRELAVQASNATNSASDRKALQAEVAQLAAEIDRVAKQTNFNGQKILDGSFAGAVFQVGANSGDNVTLGALADTRANQISNINYAVNTLLINTSDSPDRSIANFDQAIEAGQLSITVKGLPPVELERIEPANSSLERIGQVLTAINNKTADTGVTAYMTVTPGTQDYTIEFMSERVGEDNRPVEINFSGFNSSITGVGASVPSSEKISEALAQIPAAFSASAAAGTPAEFSATNKASFENLYKSLQEQFPALKDAADFKAAVLAYEASPGTSDTLTNANAIRTALTKAFAVPANATATPASTSLLGLAAAQAAFDNSDRGAQAAANYARAIKSFTGNVTPGIPTSITVPSGSNPFPEATLPAALDAIQTWASKVGMHDVLDINDAEEQFRLDDRGIHDIDVTTQAGAWVALKKIDSAVDQVNSARATLGAMQTRFENAVNNIDIQVENLSAARGRIVDADFAVETANLSRTQILQQAGTAMVAQANQIPQNVLQLLQG